MPYDRDLAERARTIGGIAFMLGDRMFGGISHSDLIVRLGGDTGLGEPHTRPFDFTGRPMTGFVYVSSDGYASDEQLRGWLDRALAFVRTLPAKNARRKS